MAQRLIKTDRCTNGVVGLAINDAINDNFEELYAGGPGGGGTWGSITGTLSTQTDLQAALDAKADDTDLNVLTTVSVNAAVVLTSDAFGKLHELTDNGGTTDYTVTLPSPVSHSGKTIYFKGLSTLTKVVTLSLAAITIDGDADIKISKGGIIGLKSNGSHYIVIAEVGSWIPWVPTPGANQFSPAAVFDAAYFKVGRSITLRCLTLTNGTSSGASTTLFTFTNLPFAPKVTGEYMTLATNASLAAARASLTAASNTVSFFSNAAGSAFTNGSAKGIHFTWTYEY
jgi:hypothetical protein